MLFPKKKGFTQFPDKYQTKYSETPPAGYYDVATSQDKLRPRAPSASWKQPMNLYKKPPEKTPEANNDWVKPMGDGGSNKLKFGPGLEKFSTMTTPRGIKDLTREEKIKMLKGFTKAKKDKVDLTGRNSNFATPTASSQNKQANWTQYELEQQNGGMRPQSRRSSMQRDDRAASSLSRNSRSMVGSAQQVRQRSMQASLSQSSLSMRPSNPFLTTPKNKQGKVQHMRKYSEHSATITQSLTKTQMSTPKIVKVNKEKKNMNLLSLIQQKDRINYEQVIDYLLAIIQTHQRTQNSNSSQAIEKIFNKILAWKKKAGNLDQQEKMVMRKLSNGRTDPIHLHNVKTLQRKMSEIQDEIGLTNDEIAIIIYTSIDLDWFTNLLICAGEFTKWFNINFEGEHREEVEFRNQKQEIFNATAQYSKVVTNEFNQMMKSNQDKEVITQQRWWQRLRYKKFGIDLAKRFKEKPQLMSELRNLFRAGNDKLCYYKFFQFIQHKCEIKLENWEEDALELRLDRLQQAYIKFNQFNEFCLVYGINWGEPVLEDDTEAILEENHNLSYQDYKCSAKDYFMGCPTMLTSEKAALAKVDLIYNNELRKQAAGQHTQKYVDLDFGPKRQSDELGSKFAMYKTGNPPIGYPKPADCVWVYGESLCDEGQNPQFIDDGVASSDCIQGKLGDCWLISAMSVLATRDELIIGGRRGMEYDENMVVDKEIADLLSKGVYPPIFHKYRNIGLYVIRIFKNFTWIYVIVDERIIVDKTTGEPVFGHCKNYNELWVSLIEKAYAKMHGCYENLISGYVDEGVQELTGFQPEKILIKNNKTGLFPSKMIEQHYGGAEGFWSFILERQDEGCLMGCSIKGDGKAGPQVLDGAPTGLLVSHAYGIQDIIQFTDPLDKSGTTKIKLLRLRNPWGKSEFNGAWSFDSEEMKKYRAMLQNYIESLPPDEHFDLDADDGTFFMSFEDWRDHFCTLFLNNDFPDEWTGVRFRSGWNKTNSGGIPNKYQQQILQRYAWNPQFLVEPVFDTDLMFSLCQTGGRLPVTGEYHDYPFTETLHYANTAVFKLPKEHQCLQAFDKDLLMLMTPIKRERENSGRCKLKAGERYVLVPSTEMQGRVGQFYLSLYFNQRLRDVHVHRIFNPMDTNLNKDEVIPYFIPEEAEKMSLNTPFWKIQLVKESLGFMITDEDVFPQEKPKALPPMQMQMSSSELRQPVESFRIDTDTDIERDTVKFDPHASGLLNIQTDDAHLKSAQPAQKAKKPNMSKKQTFLRFTIRDGTFKKDHDWFGKQDPYIQLFYNDKKVYTTAVKNGAGKYAQWNEFYDFDLTTFMAQPSTSLCMKAYDKDFFSSDAIGATNNFHAYWVIQRLAVDAEFFELKIYGENKYEPLGKLTFSLSAIQIGADKKIQQVELPQGEFDEAAQIAGKVARLDPNWDYDLVDISPKMREYIAKVWSEFDINKNGVLEMTEAKKFLNDLVGQVQGKKVQMNDTQIIQMFNLFDKDHNGNISKLEFYNIVKDWLEM